ncbi:MAG: cytochrome c [Chloroflexi bacterium]|nr:cytochrome c [Chloroflexota bacterium]
MKQTNMIKGLQIGVLVIMVVGTMIFVGLMTQEQSAHALPEYSSRTEEACGACHVNPGGGGPRTMAGLMWSAQGNPDVMPILTINIAPGVTDGAELYDIGCAGCHGLSGEGLFGPAVVGSGWRERTIETAIVRGRERSGMPAYEGQLTDEQLAALVEYTTGLASGQIEPPPISYELPAGDFTCDPIPGAEKCGGN